MMKGGLGKELQRQYRISDFVFTLPMYVNGTFKYA